MQKWLFRELWKLQTGNCPSSTHMLTEAFHGGRMGLKVNLISYDFYLFVPSLVSDFWWSGPVGRQRGRDQHQEHQQQLHGESTVDLLRQIKVYCFIFIIYQFFQQERIYCNQHWRTMLILQLVVWRWNAVKHHNNNNNIGHHSLNSKDLTWTYWALNVEKVLLRQFKADVNWALIKNSQFSMMIKPQDSTDTDMKRVHRDLYCKL